MKKILIVGSPGSGKSTFAKKLHLALSLPLVHLDQEYWSPGWVEPVKEDWCNRVTDLVANDHWIIEGNYSSTYHIRFPEADTIIYLECGRWTCLWRVLSRIKQSFGQARDDMAEGCPEHINFEFIKYIIWDFPRRSLPKLHQALKKYSCGREIIISKSFAESDEILQRLAAM